jgi:putative acetyltransferase
MSVEKSLEIRRADPASPDCRVLIEELDRLQGSLYPPENNYLDSIEELQKPNCYFLGAYLDGQIVGCGAMKMVDGRYGELKRMYVIGNQRQRGIGKRLLEALETHSLQSGVRLVRLETGVNQPGALALYRRNGYTDTKAFGHYSDSVLSVFMEKQLTGV